MGHEEFGKQLDKEREEGTARMLVLQEKAKEGPLTDEEQKELGMLVSNYGKWGFNDKYLNHEDKYPVNRTTIIDGVGGEPTTFGDVNFTVIGKQDVDFGSGNNTPEENKDD